ncbi:MAG TPA: RidA family protein [Actinomycetes bacterium]|jgi:enamine deaminase RidA (YjgF/YER057c/UK114 family)|nr:RidA family protein [Actinomycetes bacterium]
MSGEATSHRIVNPPELARPVGFAHAVLAAPGRVIFLGGQAAQGPGGGIRGTTVAEQFDVAAGNLLTALTAAGGRARDLVSLQIFVTDMAAYRAAMSELATVYQRHFGRRYVASALLEVAGLFDPAAKVELMGIAVIPGTVASPRTAIRADSLEEQP